MEFLRGHVGSLSLTFGDLAYSQHEQLGLIQAASVVGHYGVGFLMALLQAGVAASCRALGWISKLDRWYKSYHFRITCYLRIRPTNSTDHYDELFYLCFPLTGSKIHRSFVFFFGSNDSNYLELSNDIILLISVVGSLQL